MARQGKSVTVSRTAARGAPGDSDALALADFLAGESQVLGEEHVCVCVCVCVRARACACQCV